MSQSARNLLDPASQAAEGRLVDISTDGVPVRERLGFWRDTVLNRNRPLVLRDGVPFQARLRRIVLNDIELVEHASDAVESDRSPHRRQFGGGEDVAVELMRTCRSAVLEHDGEHRLRAGDMYVVDYSKPLRTRRSRHRGSGIVLSRRLVTEALGRDPADLAARRLPAQGLARLLRGHLQAAIDEASHMTVQQRTLAVRAAAEMALALLQATVRGRIDAERFSDGLYRAARRFIADRCTDPDLTPDRVALSVNCSRASLYRVFAEHDEGVGAVIWASRLARAYGMLRSAESVGMLVADIAMLCGFREVPTFTRMFRRRYGMSPSEAREASLGSP